MHQGLQQIFQRFYLQNAPAMELHHKLQLSEMPLKPDASMVPADFGAI
jgi:hypothetical protein